MSVSSRFTRPPAGVAAVLFVCAWTTAPATAPPPRARLGHPAGARCVLLADPHVRPSFVPPPAPRGLLRGVANANPAAVTAITVNYIGFTPEAQTAFQYAVGIWASQLAAPVPITVEASFSNLGSRVLGSAGPFFVWPAVPNGVANTLYPDALAGQLAGADADPGTPDVDARFSSAAPWYFGTDGKVPPGQYDFVSVVLHELGHGLGFIGSGRVASGVGSWGLNAGSGPLPFIFDRFVFNGFGQAILDTALFPNGSAALAGQMTGENLFFSGPFTRASNGNAAARLYAPPAFEDGSSYSHLDEATYTGGHPNSLMTPQIASAEAIHDPGGIVRGMFRDMGWRLSAAPACSYGLSASPASFSAAGGSGTLTISTQVGCPWSVSSPAPWIALTSAMSGTGAGAVTFTVAAHGDASPRAAQFVVGGAAQSIDQAGVPCTFGVSPTNATIGGAGGSRTITITAAASQCAWTAASSVSWITPAVSSGIGGRVLTYTVDANPSRQPRTAVLTVAGLAITILQAGARTGIADFDGDGRSDAFLYNPATGAWSVQVTRPTGFHELSGGLWATGWTVKTADFNGDGLTDLFLYNSTNGLFFKATNVGGGQFAFFGYRWAAGWTVTVIDFNGDGRSDVFLYDPVIGRWFTCVTTAGAEDFLYTAGLWAAGWQVYPADFDGDGRGDLFLYNGSAPADPNSGRWFRVMTQVDGSFGYLPGDVRWANNWTVTPGDFDGDGRSDLFLYEPGGRWFSVQFASGSAAYTGGTWAPNWTIRAADFDGDLITDLFLYNFATGQWFVGVTLAPGSFGFWSGVWAPSWTIARSDFNADGRADLLLYNPGNGSWFQASTTTPGTFTFSTGAWPTGAAILSGRQIP